MPTRIVPSNAHHSHRLEYQPGGWPTSSIERSQRFASGRRRATSKGSTKPTVLANNINAIAEGLTAEIHSIKAIANPATGNAIFWRGLLNAYISTREIRPYAPANTIGFSRFAGRKWIP